MLVYSLENIRVGLEEHQMMFLQRTEGPNISFISSFVDVRVSHLFTYYVQTCDSKEHILYSP